MQDIKLRQATSTDIQQINLLAVRIWNQHYPSIISQQQIDYMLNKMYSKESLDDQMMRKHTFFLIYYNNNAIGFISVANEGHGDWFLNKFYIDQQFAAQGVGSQSFDILIEKLGASKMSLTVNRQNYKSINFYFKKGFVIERVADFDIGDGYVMNDFVMVWKSKSIR